MRYTIYFNYVLAFLSRAIVPVCIAFSIVSLFTVMAFMVPYILIAVVAMLFALNNFVLRTIFIIQVKIYKKKHKDNEE